MKRIYLLFLLVIVLGSSAFAQRSINLSATHYNMKSGYTVDLSAPQEDTIFLTFKNLGPDSIKATDTIWVDGPLTSNFYWINHGTIKKDSSYNGYYRFTLTQAGDLVGGPNNINWCDSARLAPVSGTITDVDGANNKDCDATVMTLSIRDLIYRNGLNIYPNPVTDVLNIKHTFNENVNANISITDMTGKVIYNDALGMVYGEQKFKVDVSRFNAGVYFIQLTAGEAKHTSKISVVK